MSREIIFASAARAEFDDAVEWYERRHPGTGAALQAEVDSILERIQEYPGRYRKVSSSVRIARLKKFWQYSVYFNITASRIEVVAVFHSKRDPAILAKRLG
jgi:plasmid stabilization system protein ParE